MFNSLNDTFESDDFLVESGIDILYMSTPVDGGASNLDSAETLLRPYFDRLLSLSAAHPTPATEFVQSYDENQKSMDLPVQLELESTNSPSASCKPILELFYLQHISPVVQAEPQHHAPDVSGLVIADDTPPHTAILTEVADAAAVEGERLYREALAMLKERQSDGIRSVVGEEGERDMWPPMNPDEDQPGMDAEDW